VKRTEQPSTSFEQDVWLENLELAVGAISRQPLTAEAWFETQSFLCGLCGRQFDTVAGFSPGTSVFPCQYDCTNAPYSITDLITDAAEFLEQLTASLNNILKNSEL
jgi:hypothetical protein